MNLKGLDEVILNKHVADTILEDALSFAEQMEVHKAHVCMLWEQNIISQSDARAILVALKSIEEDGYESIPQLPGLTDLYSNLEEFLIQKIGLDIGGRIHTGRSRNDMNLTIERMYIRKLTLSLAQSIFAAMHELLKTAKEHVGTVMPGYTHHSQHAQPTTLGHYLLSVYYNLERDLERLDACYKHTNICPMGGAALTGTSFDINRDRVASLLGFNRSMTHTIDATSSLDFALEAAAATCVLISNIGRFAESMLLWSMYETGMIKIVAKYCSYSTIMPQKRNPVALETLRIEGDWGYGTLSSMFNATKAFTPGNGREPGFIVSSCIQIITRMTNAVYLFAGIISSLEVNKERCRELADNGLGSMTDLADAMVRDKGLSFAAAKKIVGDIVMVANEKHIDCRKYSPALIDASAVKIIGKPIGIAEGEIQDILDSERNVNRRKTPGGPSFNEVTNMILACEVDVRKLADVWKNKELALQESAQKLQKLVDSVVMATPDSK